MSDANTVAHTELLESANDEVRSAACNHNPLTDWWLAAQVLQLQCALEELQLDRDLQKQQLASERALVVSTEAALGEMRAEHSLEMHASQEAWSESERVWRDALQEKQLRLQASEAKAEESALMLVTEKVKLDAASEQLELGKTKRAALVERVRELEMEVAAARAAGESAESGASVWHQAFEEAEAKCRAACSSFRAIVWATSLADV